MEEFPLKETPFQPGHPVNPENFKGRMDIIQNIIRYMPNVISGNAQHFFITGKRGMGKTSLANYVKQLVQKKFKMVGVHVTNDSLQDIESLISHVIEQLLNEIESETWSKKIFRKFKDNIKSVGAFGANIELKENKEEFIKSVKNNFPQFLSEMVKDFEDKKGIFIIIDDINGLTKSPDFATWYKSFSDTLDVNFGGESPVAIMLSGYPDKLQALYNHNPSFNRIFRSYNLGPLTRAEVSSFFEDTFEKVSIKTEKEALDKMINFSTGIPTMMQEIGEGVFWEDSDNIIDENDALKGIFEAGMQIGKKFIRPEIDSSIYSPKYRSILLKMGEHAIISFKKSNFEKYLNDEEKKVFPDFLKKAKQLKILEQERARSGEYKFPNMLYPVYLAILSIKNDKL
ncbi:MAG: KAP family NTPase [Methanobrevibacter sp.]|jgi:nucleoside-triphosphatase THEP1|nr:KAP family NTPase [Candidatus Methanoflexus mossambicus]